jgi:hypothetical protein
MGGPVYNLVKFVTGLMRLFARHDGIWIDPRIPTRETGGIFDAFQQSPLANQNTYLFFVVSFRRIAGLNGLKFRSQLVGTIDVNWRHQGTRLRLHSQQLPGFNAIRLEMGFVSVRC